MEISTEPPVKQSLISRHHVLSLLRSLYSYVTALPNGMLALIPRREISLSRLLAGSGSARSARQALFLLTTRGGERRGSPSRWVCGASFPFSVSFSALVKLTGSLPATPAQRSCEYVGPTLRQPHTKHLSDHREWVELRGTSFWEKEGLERGASGQISVPQVASPRSRHEWESGQ